MAARRRSLILPFGALFVLIAGWCSYWVIASRLAADGFDKAMAREAQQGRRWTCADRTIGGFPFRFELRCASLALDASATRQPFQAKVGAVRAVALAYMPNRVIAEIDGPAEAVLASGERFGAQWSSLRLSAKASLSRLETFDSVIENLRAVVRDPQGTDRPVASAESFETHLRPAPGATETAVEIAIDGRKLVSPLLDGALGATEAGDLLLRATITGIDAIGRGSPLDNLERWRAAGGKATIMQLKVNRGRIQVDATGELGLDEQRQPVGRIEGTAAGLEQLLARGGGMLGVVINLRAPSKGMPFAVTMKDGRVMMGPIRLGTMAPLY